MELSSYFRINARNTGQFERTLIVADDDSYVSYLEGCTEADEDIYLDEFSDEIDQWVIDAIKAIGLDTAKAVLNAPREMLVEKADLEEETVDHVIEVLKAEFE